MTRKPSGPPPVPLNRSLGLPADLTVEDREHEIRAGNLRFLMEHLRAAGHIAKLPGDGNPETPGKPDPGVPSREP